MAVPMFYSPFVQGVGPYLPLVHTGDHYCAYTTGVRTNGN